MQPQQAQQQMQAASVNQQRCHSSIEPPKFNGTTQENGWYWLSKFIAYCRRAGIDITDDDTMFENFTLSIGGSAETWFMLLPHDQRDTFAHLQDAFRKRYDNPQNNYNKTDTFYYLRSLQQPAQPHAYSSRDNLLDTQQSYNFNDLTVHNRAKTFSWQPYTAS